MRKEGRQLKLEELLTKPLPKIPPEINWAIEHGKITDTAFEDKNNILFNSDLQNEVGYRKMSDGTYLVCMVCPMPEITTQMIDWWFWWHPKNSLRYKVWFPGEHIGISYNKKNQAYFQRGTLPKFEANTHYPIERIGKAVLPLRIDFVSEKEFGFSEDIMEENGIERIVCGHVGAFNNLVKHTQMAHIFKKTDDGLFMISRFWLGKTMNPILRKIIINDNMAKSMAEHCCIEYRNLKEILPILYKEFA